MGNQNSRLDRSSSPTNINDDPCLDNMRQWHTNKKGEPYKRQYPLPAIANDHNRIKPRKQSSPAAVNFAHSTRRPFTRFFSRNRLPRNNSWIDTTSTNYHTQQQQHQQVISNNNIQHNISNNSNPPNNTINTTSSSSSFNSQRLQHLIHPLSSPVASNEQRSCQQQLLPFEVESFSRQSVEIVTGSRRLNTANSSNRNSLNNTQLRLLLAQQEEVAYTYQINGKRKYHRVPGSTYLLPCDDEEIDRLHLQHFMIRFAIQG